MRVSSGRGRRLLFVLASSAVLASMLPAHSLAANPVPPYLYSSDAPFTRNRTVDIGFVPGGGTITTYLLSNDDASVDSEGVLANGTSVSASGPWTLPAQDGAHTVYGQIQYATGEWMIVLHLDFYLSTAPSSSLYVDFDVVNAGGQDGHAISRSASTRFTAYKTPVDSSPATGFVVSDGTWLVGFYNGSGSFTPGMYTLGSTVGMSIAHAPLHTTCTVTGGTFTITQVSLYEGQDLNTADIDFRVTCGTNVMAGSVRYGSSRSVVALDQNRESFQFGQVNVGEGSAQTVTLTNIGDAAVVLGTAAVSGGASFSHPEDYSISADTCSSSSLAANASCQLEVTFAPGGILNRNAMLTIGDNTPAGSRRWRLIGSGVQPTALTLSATGSTAAPGPVTFKMSISPPTGEYGPLFSLENGPPLHTLQWTVQELASPPRREYSTTVELAPGTYTASASFATQFGYVGSSAGPVEVVMTGDATPPTGEVIITATGGTPYTNDPNVRIQFPAEDNETAVTELAITTSNWGMSTWVTYPFNEESADQDWYLPAGDPNYFGEGTYTIRAKWKNAAAVWSEPVDATIALDTLAPKVDPPPQLLVESSRIVNGKVLVEVPLSGSGGLSGLSDFDLGQKTDSGAWKPVDVPGISAITITDTSVDRLLAPQHRYTFRGRATDGATNISSWVKGPSVNLKRLQESSSRIRYAGTWKTVSKTSYWGGSARKSTSNGATASLTLTGRAVAWVANTGPDRGKARVYVDGKVLKTVDLYSPTASSQVVVWAQNWSAAGTHTVRIEVFGSGKVIELDGFVTAE